MAKRWCIIDIIHAEQCAKLRSTCLGGSMRSISLMCLWLLLAPDVHAQTAYYPLQQGNSWQFNGNGPWHRVNVSKDTVLPNGKQYALVEGGPFHLQRQEGARVYEFNGQSDGLLFDFSKSPGDTLISFPGTSDTFDIVLIARDSVSVFGHRLRRWSFGFNWRRAIDDEEGYDIVDSIGIAGISLANGTEVLQSALIDGTLFQTTDVAQLPTASGSSFLLVQNYPNPFNPSTTICYGLPNRSHVLLTIFNTLGQQVALLQNGDQDAGSHEVKFDGSHLGSGVYFYRIQAGSLVQTRRLLLIR